MSDFSYQVHHTSNPAPFLDTKKTINNPLVLIMAPIMKLFYAGLLAASTFTSAAFASPIDNTGVAIEARGEILFEVVLHK